MKSNSSKLWDTFWIKKVWNVIINFRNSKNYYSTLMTYVLKICMKFFREEQHTVLC